MKINKLKINNLSTTEMKKVFGAANTKPCCSCTCTCTSQPAVDATTETGSQSGSVRNQGYTQ